MSKLVPAMLIEDSPTPMSTGLEEPRLRVGSVIDTDKLSLASERTAYSYAKTIDSNGSSLSINTYARAEIEGRPYVDFTGRSAMARVDEPLPAPIGPFRPFETISESIVTKSIGQLKANTISARLMSEKLNDRPAPYTLHNIVENLGPLPVKKESRKITPARLRHVANSIYGYMRRKSEKVAVTAKIVPKSTIQVISNECDDVLPKGIPVHENRYAALLESEEKVDADIETPSALLKLRNVPAKEAAAIVNNTPEPPADVDVLKTLADFVIPTRKIVNDMVKDRKSVKMYSKLTYYLKCKVFMKHRDHSLLNIMVNDARIWMSKNGHDCDNAKDYLILSQSILAAFLVDQQELVFRKTIKDKVNWDNMSHVNKTVTGNLGRYFKPPRDDDKLFRTNVRFPVASSEAP